MQFPDDPTGDILRRMHAFRFDFSREYPIEFFALLPTKCAATSVIHEYLAEHRWGEPLEDYESRPGPGGGIELIVVKRMRPTHENITEFEKEFDRRAANQGGYSDGWNILESSEQEEIQSH